MLAAQSAAAEARPPTLARKLSRLWSSKPAPDALEPGPLELTAPAGADAPPTRTSDEPLWLEERVIYPSEPIPAEILLGEFCPRRPAFGQRAEGALDPRAPPASPPQRLMLMDLSGDAIGELIAQGGLEASAPARRPFEPLHAETPFFPEDLADDPAPRARLRPRAKPEPAPAPPEPAPEMAATFLLATLAARLASEQAALGERLAKAFQGRSTC